MYIKHAIAALAAVSVLVALPGARAESDAAESVTAESDSARKHADEIRLLVEQFRTAIIGHQGMVIESLFLPEKSHWLDVVKDPLYAKAKLKHPDVKRINQSSAHEFAQFVSEAKTPIEERFYKVRVHTDGTIGTVYFDFDFLDNGVVVNRGSETWQVIHTDAGWRIASMLYSSGGKE